MKFTPVDVSRLQVMVVREPREAIRDGKPVIDRDTGRPQWNIDVAVISDFGVETEQFGLPEGGFPKDLTGGVFIIPEGWTAIKWDNDKGKHGDFHRVKSVKVVGGSSGLKSVAA